MNSSLILIGCTQPPVAEAFEAPERILLLPENAIFHGAEQPFGMLYGQANGTRNFETPLRTATERLKRGRKKMLKMFSK